VHKLMSLDKSLVSSLFGNLSNEELGSVSEPPPRKSCVELVEEELENDGKLGAQYIVPPFSVIDLWSERWPAKQRKWITVFDPLLCECVYLWFAPLSGGHVLDPFGDATRGIVAGCRGYEYTGIVSSREQIEVNERQSTLLSLKYPAMKVPTWVCGNPDSLEELLPFGKNYDLMFTDIPIYSHKDLTPDCLERYRKIFHQAAARLKQGRFAVVLARSVRGEVFIEFPEETVRTFFQDTGTMYYNRIELVMGGRQHSGIQCFWKGEREKEIPEALGFLGATSD
jgi:hypothetical protein